MPLDGYAYAGTCYASKDEAVDAFASSHYPRSHSVSASCVYMLSASWNPAQGRLIVSGPAPQGATCPPEAIAWSYQVDPVRCDLKAWTPAHPWLSVNDAVQVSLAIVGVWMLAWGWKAIYRTLRGTETGADD